MNTPLCAILVDAHAHAQTHTQIIEGKANPLVIHEFMRMCDLELQSVIHIVRLCVYSIWVDLCTAFFQYHNLVL